MTKLSRIDLYYSTGICKTAVGESAENFEKNLSAGHVADKDLLPVKFIDRKELSDEAINLIVQEAVFGISGNELLVEKYASLAVKKALHEQKKQTLKELFLNCNSNGYEALFDVANIILELGEAQAKTLNSPELLSRFKNCANQIRSAAHSLLI